MSLPGDSYCGIRRFLDLTEAGEHTPYTPLLGQLAAERGLEVEHTRMAIPDFSVPAPSRMRETLDQLEAELGREEPVYVHCRGGAGRTGTAVWRGRLISRPRPGPSARRGGR